MSEPSCSVVALSLLSFTAVAGNRAVNLNWITTPGTIDHFEIERSLNGTAFEKIRTVPAQSNRSNYSYVDPGFQTDVWYRLKVVLQDGSVNFSRVIVIKAGSSGSSFPNPFNDDLTVVLIAGQSDRVFISMTDQMGRKVLQKTIPLSAGKNVLLLDSKALANGIYMLHIVNGSNQVLRNEKVMKF